MDKHRRRFNMRMLVPGRPVKDSAVPPPVPAERPSYKEKFIPPELSMLDYFVAKVGLSDGSKKDQNALPWRLGGLLDKSGSKHVLACWI